MNGTDILRPLDVAPTAGRRVRRASLRDRYGERLGRFALHDEGGGRVHRWEWFERWWPAAPFAMVPDDGESAPAPDLSRTLALPARIVRPRPGQLIGVGADCLRLYDVRRGDDGDRPLAVLAVRVDRLEWWEVGAGGAVELAPAWLHFVPREAPPDPLEITRGLLQLRTVRARPAGLVRCRGAESL